MRESFKDLDEKVDEWRMKNQEMREKREGVKRCVDVGERSIDIRTAMWMLSNVIALGG